MKKYPNIVRHGKSPYWHFRKYSAEKRARFTWSTGVLAEPHLQKQAHSIGLKAFAEWLGSTVSFDASTCGDIARALLHEKRTKRPRTLESAEYAWRTLEPYFGSMLVGRAASRWIDFRTSQRQLRGDVRLFNARKLLIEILRRAKSEGLITEVPSLALDDPQPAKPKFISRLEYYQILRSFKRGSGVKHLAFIMYRQGARPTEVLNYTWDMVTLETPTLGRIAIPGTIVKTGRSREIPLNRRVARYWWRTPASYRVGRIVGVSNFKRSFRMAMDRLGYDYSIYNLRDTFITNAVKRGQASINIGKYCDTSSAMIEKKYAVGTQEILKGVAG